MRIVCLLLFSVIFTLFTASFALAGIENATVSVGATGNLTEGSESVSAPVTAQGGNVTNVDIETNVSTTKWQGFYGNVSGNLVLGLNTNVLYDFGSGAVVANTIYATQNSSFNFAGLNEGNATDVDNVFGFTTGGDPDQAVDVFTIQTSPDTLVNTNSTTLADGNFQCFLANDGNEGNETYMAFGGIVNANQAGFNGQLMDYELLVPVRAGTTPVYYFYMSI